MSGVESGEGRFPQVAGMRFYYDSTKQKEVVDSVANKIVTAGQRIANVQIKNADGTYSDIKPNAYYIVATNSFMADGGDFYASMKQAKNDGRHYELNLVDYEVFRSYLDTIGEVNRSVEGRITDLLGEPLPSTSGSAGTTNPNTSTPANGNDTGSTSGTDNGTDNEASSGDTGSNTETGGTGSSGTDTGSTSGSSNAVSFEDVAADYWAAVGIQNAVERGIASGYPDGTFRPDGATTRAEFAAMLGRAFGLKGDAASASSQFTDWSRIPQWARAFVAQEAAAGIIGGYADGSFRPSEKITRAEMVVMIVRALGLEPSKQGAENAARLPFTDAAIIPAWAVPYFAAAYEAGLTQGLGDKLDPNAKATRAEVVTLLVDVLYYIGK